jgi:hypothetical protein
MSYKFITEIDHRDVGELGSSGDRFGFFDELAKDLRAATAAKKLAAEGSGKPPAGGTLKAIKEFHESAAVHARRLQAANAEVVRLRSWLERMGGKLDKHDQLDWGRSIRTVNYDSQLQQGFTKVDVEGGRLLWAHNRNPVDTSEMVTAFSGPGKAIFALSATDAGPGGGLHVSSHSVGERHHSSLLAATQQWIAGAGEIKVRRGWIQWISNKSGHYQPNLFHFLQVLHHLQKNQVVLNFSVTLFPQETFYSSMDKFMLENGLDDDSYDYNNLIHAYFTQVNDPNVLGAHGWEFRPEGVGTPRKPVRPGVYIAGTSTKVDSREVRHWLRKIQNYAPLATEHSGAQIKAGGTRVDD